MSETGFPLASLYRNGEKGALHFARPDGIEAHLDAVGASFSNFEARESVRLNLASTDPFSTPTRLSLQSGDRSLAIGAADLEITAIEGKGFATLEVNGQPIGR